MSKEYPLSFHEINSNPEGRIDAFKRNSSPIVLLLDGIEDARNMGAIFRLADACRIAKIYSLRQNQTFDRNKVERISRQTTDHIEYKILESLNDVSKLAETYYPVALEYTNKSIPFKDYKDDSPCMLVIGNERRGVSEDLLNICKCSLHVPMLGNNSSMNVSVASGIVLYHLLGNMNLV